MPNGVADSTHVGVFPPYASAIVDGRSIGRFFHGYEKEH